MTEEPEAFRYRTIFLSDAHLGTRGCQAELLLDFSSTTRPILLSRRRHRRRLAAQIRLYWPQAHNDVVQKLLRKVRKGARIFYVPGNHDEFARQYVGLSFGGIVVVDRIIHTTVDGRRFLVIHGDEFDIVVRHARWLALLGDWAYDLALFLNTYFNLCRRAFGFGYWSFSAWAKLKVKNAVNFIGAFEAALSEEAKRQEVDGVVCGHIHHAAIRDIGGITYVNTGDFVESCTAVVEHDDGRLEILRWQNFAGEQAKTGKYAARPAKAAA